MSNIVEARAIVKEIDNLLDAMEPRAYNEVQRVYDGQTWHLMRLIQAGWITEINGEALEDIRFVLGEIKALTPDLWKSIKVGDTIEWYSSKDDARILGKVLEIGETSVRVDREWCNKPDNMWVNVFWDNGYDVKIIC